MRRRRGFTLIELTVAMVLMSTVALLGYGALRTSFDTQSRVMAARDRRQEARALRALLQDALRSTRGNYGEAAFVLDDRTDASGRPIDRLTFVAVGGTPPLTPESDWRVVIEPTAEGLAIDAFPIGVRAEPRSIAKVPGIVGMDVRVLGFGKDAGWGGRWMFQSIVPEAIEITYEHEDGVAINAFRLTIPSGGAVR